MLRILFIVIFIFFRPTKCNIFINYITLSSLEHFFRLINHNSTTLRSSNAHLYLFVCTDLNKLILINPYLRAINCIAIIANSKYLLNGQNHSKTFSYLPTPFSKTTLPLHSANFYRYIRPSLVNAI